MRRHVLHHEGHEIPLADGETLVGRALDCRVRFNDPAVSRHHLRLIQRGDSLVVENLSNTNGTLVNGSPLTSPRELREGDVLRVGYRRVVVAVSDSARPRAPTGPIVAEPAREAAPGSGLLVDDEQVADERTRPGDQVWQPAPTDVTRPMQKTGATITQALADRLTEHTCPRCRARVPYYEDTCRACGYAWPPGRPASQTQEIVLEQVALRAYPRYAIRLPVVYSSETLTIDAIVRDVSRGGVFIATELLDPLGTTCELTALPDGHPAVTFEGVVAHVVQDSNHQGRPAGIGVRFTGASDEASAWLDSVLGQFAAVRIEPE
jgi:ribosomal protein L40E